MGQKKHHRRVVNCSSLDSSWTEQSLNYILCTLTNTHTCSIFVRQLCSTNSHSVSVLPKISQCCVLSCKVLWSCGKKEKCIIVFESMNKLQIDFNLNGIFCLILRIDNTHLSDPLFPQIGCFLYHMLTISNMI